MKIATILIPPCMFFGSCFQALATPPDIINVRDEFFGVSESSIFVLRITYDNLGLHDSAQRDVVLVALDRRTQEETSWPVYRARSAPDYEQDEAGATSRIDRLALPDAVDPFEMLGELGGMPVGAKDMGYHVAAEPEMRGDAVVIAYDDGAEFRSDMGTLLQGVTVSLNALAERLGDYDRMAPVHTRDLLGDLAFRSDECRISDPHRFNIPWGTAPTLAARLTCDDNEGQFISLLVLVPSA